MADLGEAFTTLKNQKKLIQNIDYFFTQRTLIEEQEYLDKNMNRKIKKNKVNHNFLALNIPTISSINNDEKTIGFDIEIFGDDGYHYKGGITSYEGVLPSLLIPISSDKKLFVHINYKIINNNNNITKNFVNFIEVPKRFQILNESEIE